MLAIHFENGAALAIGGVVEATFGLATERDAAGLLVESGAEVLHGPRGARELGEKAGLGVGVVPDVGARAVATANAFPAPEAAVLPPVGCSRGERARRH